jgi:hypothetical protein
VITRYTWGYNQPGYEGRWTVLRMVTNDVFIPESSEEGVQRAFPDADWEIQHVSVYEPELTEFKAKAIAFILNGEEPY